MSTPSPRHLELPAGTVVALHPSGGSFTFTWRSVRGLHIVRSKIPARWCQQAECTTELAEAVRAFKLAIAREAEG